MCIDAPFMWRCAMGQMHDNDASSDGARDADLRAALLQGTTVRLSLSLSFVPSFPLLTIHVNIVSRLTFSVPLSHLIRMNCKPLFLGVALCNI
jgi:hypothetical protein